MSFAPSTLKELMQHIPQIGTVQWIGVRPIKRGPLVEVSAVEVTIEKGLENDHYSKTDGNRMVTLIQAEHLQVVENIMGIENLDPKLLRRNIVVAGINLLALKDQVVRIGDEVLLSITGQCHPCSRMEENLGAGGYSAMRGHGGMTAKVLHGGSIKIGDSVKMELP
ncbi:MAG: MOSC domain-containing protein [Saprospiraceae bacterium]|nr:MOSC domain-containing protein [Saprospiraceae bacterium]